MVEPISPPMEQARIEIPTRWYEYRLPLLGAISLVTIPAVYFQEKYLPIGSLAEHVGSAALYCMAVVGDLRSTRQGFAVADDAARHGIKKSGIVEANPIIGRVTNLADYEHAAKQKRVIISEAIAAAAVIAQPPIGIGLGMLRVRDTIGNRRVTRRAKRAIELVDQCPGPAS